MHAWRRCQAFIGILVSINISLLLGNCQASWIPPAVQRTARMNFQLDAKDQEGRGQEAGETPLLPPGMLENPNFCSHQVKKESEALNDVCFESRYA